MRYWMVKSEPDSYSWTDLVNDGKTAWTGVRNHQARNNLAGMGRGDRVLFYHSGAEKAVVGVAEVVREAYPDPTTADERWVCVDVARAHALKRPVTLQEIKGHPALTKIALVRNTRLSVLSLEPEEFEEIVRMSAR